MLLPGIRRLALSDLDADGLRNLVDHGEDLLVERKRALPKSPGFGAAVASFANTLGGWILLGVGDDKRLHGYEKPPQLDLQSYLAAVLREQCDPLPPFVAEIFPLDGVPIAVLRIFESTDPPHIVRGTGAVYVRTSKGKEPVDDHRTLLELARRGDEAERRARERLRTLPLIQFALIPPDVDPRRVARGPDPSHVQVYVRAAPLTVSAQLTEWPTMGNGGGQGCFIAAEELLPSDDSKPSVTPAARGAIARKQAWRDPIGRKPWTAVAVADSGGAVGVSLARRADEFPDRVLETKDLRRDMLRPALNATVRMLMTAEAHGRAALDAWVCISGRRIRVRRQRRAPVPRATPQHPPRRRAHDPGGRPRRKGARRSVGTRVRADIQHRPVGGRGGRGLR